MRPRNTLGVVAGTPRVHNVDIYIFFTQLFWYKSCDRIEPPYLFCLATFLKLALCSGPDLARLKNPMEPPQGWMLSENGSLRSTSCVREISFILVPGRSKIESQKIVENGFPLLELKVEVCGKSVKDGESSLAAWESPFGGEEDSEWVTSE